MADTPQAEAVDAQLAEDAATKAALASQEAIKNAQVVAAAAEEKSAEKVATIAEKTGDALQRQESDLGWLKEHATATNSAFQTQQQELAALRQETAGLKTGQTQLAEALAGLTTLLTQQKQPQNQEAVEPAEKAQKEGAVDQKEAAKKKVYRRM